MLPCGTPLLNKIIKKIIILTEENVSRFRIFMFQF